jgi:hypothetical protein
MNQPRPATTSSATPSAIRIHIGRITLVGYTATDRVRFSDALRVSLTQLASAKQSYKSNLSVKRINAGQLRPGASIEEAARVIATRLFEGIDV